MYSSQRLYILAEALKRVVTAKYPTSEVARRIVHRACIECHSFSSCFDMLVDGNRFFDAKVEDFTNRELTSMLDYCRIVSKKETPDYIDSSEHSLMAQVAKASKLFTQFSDRLNTSGQTNYYIYIPDDDYPYPRSIAMARDVRDLTLVSVEDAFIHPNRELVAAIARTMLGCLYNWEIRSFSYIVGLYTDANIRKCVIDCLNCWGGNKSYFEVY